MTRLSVTSYDTSNAPAHSRILEGGRLPHPCCPLPLLWTTAPRTAAGRACRGCGRAGPRLNSQVGLSPPAEQVEMMTADETQQHELEAQLQTATGELQRAVMRLFQDRDIHPHLVVLALARVTGEVGAGTALAGERDPEELLDDLAGVVRRAGREFREMVQAEAMPTAGNA